MIENRWHLHRGDAAAVLKTLPAASFDALVTDPPAGIAFMGRKWDDAKGGRQKWVAWLADILAEVRRVMKPGAYGFIWALPRTSHWTGDAIEQAGFEVRDVTHDALSGSTLLDQFLGSLSAEQAGALERLLEAGMPSKLRSIFGSGFPKSKACLKPAVEEWFLVRNPGAPVADLRIDDCRIKTSDNLNGGAYANNPAGRHDGEENWRFRPGGAGNYKQPPGRWPAHLVLEHAAGCVRVGEKSVRSSGHYPAKRGMGSQVSGPSGHSGQDGLEESYTDGEVVPVWECAEGCPVRMLGEQSGTSRSSGGRIGNKGGGQIYSNGKRGLKGNFEAGDPGFGDQGTAARFFHQIEADPFFYAAKASRAERNAGCGGQNSHPTVKNLRLMRHLCRLVCPKGGIVLDPFCGSGTTGVACAAEGLRFCGIELEEAYADLAEARLKHASEAPSAQGEQLALV